MARRTRDWDTLGERQRQRYLNATVNRGLSAAQIRQQYESGASLKVLRGHGNVPTGIGEKRWSQLRAAAKRAKLHEDGDANLILRSLLSKGFTFAWILNALNEKTDSRNTYRGPIARALRKQAGRNSQAGHEPGRSRFYNRPKIADLELFYYH